MTESQTASPAIVERPCRACGNALDSILDLGRLRLSTFPALGDPPLPAAPLDLCACAACRLVQLRHTVDRAHLFAHEYWYRSGVNETMRAELEDLVRTALPRIGGLWPGDVAVDVGANDGTLLQAIPPEVIRIAVEPAANLHEALRPHCDLLDSTFFPADPALVRAPGS